MASPLGYNAHQAACVPRIFNVTLTSANTEYPQALPTNTRKFTIVPRTSTHVIKYAFNEGESGTLYMSIGAAGAWNDNIGIGNLTIYMQSTTAGAVVEIEAWS